MEVRAQRWMAALAAFAIIAGTVVVANAGSCAVASGHELVGPSCWIATIEAPALWIANQDAPAVLLKELFLLVVCLAVLLLPAPAIAPTIVTQRSTIRLRHALLPNLSTWKFIPYLAIHGG